MTRDDIIRMAREAGWTGPEENVTYVAMLERFAKLIAAAEREKWKCDELHTCHPHCDRPACVAVRRAREDEREACAKIVDEMAGKDRLSNYFQVAALAIRERGAP